MTVFLGYMARDQWGTELLIGNHSPRKWLLNYFGRKHADRIFVDRSDGTTSHIGWIIAGHWLNVYRIHELQERK